MRTNATPAEARLWQALRGNRLNGLKARRQIPIGPYIADFVIPAAKLIIELDGSQHADNTTGDTIRTEWLKTEGYQLLRFWNGEILTNLDAVLGAIVQAARPLSPLASRVALSPAGEGK